MELGSDEDDIDEEGQEYLEMLAKQAGEDGDDEDWEEDDAEETALEGYTTAVDDEDNPVDEYQIFKVILQSKAKYPQLTEAYGKFWWLEQEWLFEISTSSFILASISDIQSRDPAWYQALIQTLDEEQRKQLQDIGTLADQRRAAHGTFSSALMLNIKWLGVFWSLRILMIFDSRIKNDWEARRIQVHSPGGANQLQFRRQCSRNELKPLSFSYSVTDCSEVKKLVLSLK